MLGRFLAAAKAALVIVVEAKLAQPTASGCRDFLHFP